MKKNTNTIRNKIQEELDLLGWSQAKLAYEAGITPQTLNYIMRGKKTPKEETLKQIALALGVYPKYLKGEILYKNYDHWLDMLSMYTLSENQEKKLFNLLDSWGYSITGNDRDDTGFVSVVCPDGTKKILCKWHLDYILHTLFTMFNSILIDEELVPDYVLNLMK